MKASLMVEKYIKYKYKIGFSNITYLPELEVWEPVLTGELREYAGEVDAGRGPGRVEGDHPDHVLVAPNLLSEVVVAEVDNVLGALVSRLGKQEALT